jgi:hypothetical protein
MALVSISVQKLLSFIFHIYLTTTILSTREIYAMKLVLLTISTQLQGYKEMLIFQLSARSVSKGVNVVPRIAPIIALSALQ